MTDEPRQLPPLDEKFPGITKGPDGRDGVKLPNCNYWIVDPYVADNDRAQAAYNAAATWVMTLSESEVLKTLPATMIDPKTGEGVLGNNRAEEVAAIHAIKSRDTVLIPRVLVNERGGRVLPDQYTERQLRLAFKDDPRVIDLLSPFLWELLAFATDPLG